MEKVITKTLVPESKRSNFLPRNIGSAFLKFEMNVYGWMDRLCSDYSGGFWQFYDLSNGGFYMAYDDEEALRVVFDPNYFEENMTSDAVSIAANLFALNALCWQQQGSGEVITDAYYALRDYAADHKEGAKIMRLID
jgi:hypothetical protein